MGARYRDAVQINEGYALLDIIREIHERVMNYDFPGDVLGTPPPPASRSCTFAFGQRQSELPGDSLGRRHRAPVDPIC